jgi:hypothetical protein
VTLDATGASGPAASSASACTNFASASFATSAVVAITLNTDTFACASRACDLTRKVLAPAAFATFADINGVSPSALGMRARRGRSMSTGLQALPGQEAQQPAAGDLVDVP